MGYTALSNLLHDLGSRGEPVRMFEQELIDNCSKNVAIDGHVLRSCSLENDLAEPGYKLGLLKAPQVNVLIAYDIKNRIPLMYRTYRGSSVDKKSVEDLLASRSFRDTKFMVDRGFFSDTVLKLMSRDGNCYIIPLAVSNKNVKRIKETLQYTSGEFVYKSGRKDTARIIYYEEQIDDATRIIVYKDVDENNSKRKSYQQLMDMGENNYTQENYDKYCDWWGVYFLQTTSRDPAPVVYSDYKGRWSIETYNNYVKNDADFNDLKIQDYYVQQLVRSTYKGDPIFQEQTLLASLWTKDINHFWYHFYDYVELHPNSPMPRYYQEAAYLYGKLQERSDLDKMPFDTGIKDGFERFATSMSHYDGKEEIVARQELYPFFGDTYYYDYYAMRHLPEY